jgi:hypothetical protein
MARGRRRWSQGSELAGACVLDRRRGGGLGLQPCLGVAHLAEAGWQTESTYPPAEGVWAALLDFRLGCPKIFSTRKTFRPAPDLWLAAMGGLLKPASARVLL